MTYKHHLQPSILYRLIIGVIRLRLSRNGSRTIYLCVLRNKAQKEHSLGVPTLWKKLFSVLYFNVHVKNKYAGASAFAAFKSETGLDFFLSDHIGRKIQNLWKWPIQKLGCLAKIRFLLFCKQQSLFGADSLFYLSKLFMIWDSKSNFERRKYNDLFTNDTKIFA